MNRNWKKFFRIAGMTIVWIAGIWIVLLSIVQIAFSGRVLTPIINKVAAEYVDGYLTLGNASVSMFRKFPAVALTLEDLLIEQFPCSIDTDKQDTVLATITMKRMMLAGMVNLKNIHRSRIRISLDSMTVDGQTEKDTLRFVLDRLHLHGHGKSIGINAVATAHLATDSSGRMTIPIGIDGILNLPRDSVPAATTDGMKINILGIPLRTDADLRFGKKFTAIKTGITIPETTLTHPDFPNQQLTFSLGANAGTDATGRLDIDLKHFDAAIKGVAVTAKGRIKDISGTDPTISIDGNIAAHIDTLVNFLPDTLGIYATGKLNARIEGNARLSQLSLYNFSQSSLSGEVTGDSIRVEIPADTLRAEINGIRITLGPEEKSSRRDSTRTFRLVGITGEIGSADISYKDALTLNTTEFRISAKNMTDSQVSLDTTKTIYPFSGSISAGKLNLKDSEGTAIRIRNTRNSFHILPKNGQQQVPLLTLSSRNSKIAMRSDVGRAVLTDARIRVSAAMNTTERHKKRREFRDSLSRRHIPRLSMSEWMKEEDFRKSDIDIRLDREFAEYFRNWDIKGSAVVERGTLMTPYFPLRNRLDGFDLKFTNNNIVINRLDIRTGDSELTVKGELTGLKRALLGRKGALKLNADITSKGINANQLLAAYTAGFQFNPQSFSGKENLSDEEFEKHVVMDTSATATAPSLIIVPANLNADITLDASDIIYSDLHINTLTAELTMKERCVQITDTKALTNMGDISVEGFYATRSKKDLKTGFSLNFKDITAEKVINLMPSIDTLMPLLKSFGGLLNCEIAATAQLDTNMNILMPSINGVMRIGGENLTVKNNEMFRKVARMLVFKNRKEGRIDRMSVEGVIKDSKVEIFPFILELDRYMLGLSGIQNMDMSFRYHASLIRSPFLIKLGMDIYGNDFDHIKFKLGRAKYKNRNVPAFSTVIDNTKVNLVESIHNIFDKGVEAAINENRRFKAIEEHKKSINYVQAVDQKMEELSAEEQKKIEEEKK